MIWCGKIKETSENTVKILCKNHSKRRNIEDDLFMFMACFGKGTVVISNEVLKRGKIPYYGMAWSNIASKRVAINAGYKPVWVEMKVKKI